MYYTNKFKQIELIKEWFGFYLNKDINTDLIERNLKRVKRLQEKVTKDNYLRSEGRIVFELQNALQNLLSSGVLVSEDCKANKIIKDNTTIDFENVYLYENRGLLTVPCGQGDDEENFQELINYLEIEKPKLYWAMENYCEEELWVGEVNCISDVTKYYNANKEVNFLDNAGICMHYGLDVGINFYEAYTIDDLTVVYEN